jgi:hypothetical protein
MSCSSGGNEFIRERNALLEERKGQLALAKETMKDEQSRSEILSRLIHDLQRPTDLAALGSLTFVQGETVTNIYGDGYQNYDSVVLAEGRESQATGNKVTQQSIRIELGDLELVPQLHAVKDSLLQQASSAADFDAVAGVRTAAHARSTRRARTLRGAGGCPSGRAGPRARPR